MSKKKRSFQEFLASEGELGIKKVATQYATECDLVTMDTISEWNNLSYHGVRKLFEHAITNCIVTFQTVTLMKEKSHWNQINHYSDLYNDGDLTKPSSSDEYYDKLLKKRFITVKNFPDDKVLEIVASYICSPQLSAQEIADSVGLSVKELNAVLKKAIIFDIVDDQTMSQLCNVALAKTIDDKDKHLAVSSQLMNYKSLRAIYIALNSKIAQLRFQFETHDAFLSSEDEMYHPKEYVEKELEKAEKSLADFNASFF